MSLSKGQRKNLQFYADAVATCREDDPAELHITVHGYRPQREFGRGYPVSIVIVYTVDDTHDLPRRISLCSQQYTAIEKGKEIARYLRDQLKVPEGRIRLKKGV